ncbi:MULTISPECIES: hypothetical protein [Maribacter]|uniref:Uncharacterized protein n=1 Tax=Maribacter stanieri TaxID=440514 RepID=A0A1I6INI1_9FLAO|nr:MULTISPECIES: hypothetical protein [Maribacter]SFR68284.1 hypothetical protein SAMN04488010_2000 [Maribacter stanieri]SFR68298.1 hypothetical protein SAMN04488010_2002 [Maribacter stanieri]
MKSFILLTVLFFTSFLVQAQANDENVSVEIKTVEVEMIETIDTENTTEVARLYKNKNNRVIKALKFSTKLNSAKLS